jgi:predicted hydrocarbon binding protein
MAKAKGTTLLTLVKFLRIQKQAARERLSSDLHHYLEERIQPALWYPEEDLLGLIRVMLELLPISREAALARMGHEIAREHLEGVYGHLRVEEPTGLATLARKSYALWASMHDSGRMAARLEAEGQASFELRDYGLPSPEMCTILSAYFAETLRMAGAADLEVRKLDCRAEGAPTCRWKASWQIP